MKRTMLLVVLLFATAFAAMAVPRGLYSDNKGKNQVLVSDNGQIHFLDANGNVTKTLEVVKENSDGSFVTKDISNGVTFVDNAYWYEDGVLYLNLAQKMKTLQRE